MTYKQQELSKIKESINNKTKHKIINHLKNNTQLYLGNIIKNLSLNPKNGTKHIIELKYLGLVKNVQNSTLLELNTDLLSQLESAS